jgi:hypothetical protein
MQYLLIRQHFSMVKSLDILLEDILDAKEFLRNVADFCNNGRTQICILA